MLLWYRTTSAVSASSLFQWTLSRLPINSRSLCQSNGHVRVAGLYCFPVQRYNITSLLSVCLPDYLVSFSPFSVCPTVPSLRLNGKGHSSHFRTVFQTRHSAHPPHGSKAIDSSFSAVSRFVHFLELNPNSADTPASHHSGMNTLMPTKMEGGEKTCCNRTQIIKSSKDWKAQS